MSIRKHLSIIAGATLLLASCSTPKDITYFPELSTGSMIEARQYLDIKVQPEDKLSIVVSTQDPALSALFNLVTSSNSISSNSQGGGIIGGSAGGGGQISYYTVDPYGDINFPVLGKIHIAGLSRYQVAEKITEELEKSNQVKDPIVTVEFASASIAMIGEVKSPGRYGINEDHVTIIDAIAMAGDLTINGMRDNILVMRDNGNGKYESYRVNLLNAGELAASPVFYMQQGDVVYVEPNNKTKRETTPNGNSPFTPSFWISLGSVALTITSLVITLTK